MSYCLNPECPKPQNPARAQVCQGCGSSLRLNERYRIQQELGRGGFGATFLAVDESLPGHPNCVIKQLRPATSSPHMLKMARDLFKREAKTLGKVGDHPQVPRLLNYFEEKQEFYLVQEYISGSTLQQEVKRSGPFSEAGVKQFLSEILPMIEYIHGQEVIHRDIKPANLIRREQDKKLVLIDFGAVKDKINPQRASASEQTALTQYAIGTPGYAPPEQMAMRPIFASDVYALGVTCLYLLTGRSPKDMDYDPATGELMWNEYVHISDHFSDVLRRMLEVSVRHRYQSATEVLHALDLVPYMDSLADSMVSPRAQRSRKDIPHSDELTHSGALSTGPPSSPSARLAAQIRARKKRKLPDSSSHSVRNGRMHSGQLTGGRAGERSDGRLGSYSGHSTGRSSGSLGHSRSTGTVVSQTSSQRADQVLASYSRGRRNFSSCDLSLMNFQQANLAGANFHAANFRQARLARTNLQQADLGGANFGQASLSQAVLRDANLVGAFLTNADLANADLRGANLSYAHLRNANLRGANLCGADLTGAKITEAQLAMARTNWKTIHPNKKRTLW